MRLISLLRLITEKDQKDLHFALTDLMVTVEILEHPAHPPLFKSLFRATKAASPMTEEQFLTGDGILHSGFMASLLTNDAEQTIRAENFTQKFGLLLAKREERKRDRESAAASALLVTPTTPARKKALRRKTTPRFHQRPFFASPVAAEEPEAPPPSPKVDYERLRAVLAAANECFSGPDVSTSAVGPHEEPESGYNSRSSTNSP